MRGRSLLNGALSHVHNKLNVTLPQAWRSHKMHWCDVCKCWLNDTKAAIAHHEAGMGHKANLARSEFQTVPPRQLTPRALLRCSCTGSLLCNHLTPVVGCCLLSIAPLLHERVLIFTGHRDSGHVQEG